MFLSCSTFARSSSKAPRGVFLPFKIWLTADLERFNCLAVSAAVQLADFIKARNSVWASFSFKFTLLIQLTFRLRELIQLTIVMLINTWLTMSGREINSKNLR